jgi:nitrite reductase (NADH) small subunit
MRVASDFINVASENEVLEGEGLVVRLEGREIALFRIDGEVHAVDNECPHRGGPIGEGLVREGIVTCPWHEWGFEIRTGKCTINPAATLRRHQVRLENGRVLVSRDPE